MLGEGAARLKKSEPLVQEGEGCGEGRQLRGGRRGSLWWERGQAVGAAGRKKGEGSARWEKREPVVGEGAGCGGRRP